MNLKEDSKEFNNKPYDYFKLHSVVEFGLNDSNGMNHLMGDFDRLVEKKQQIDNKYIIHLNRVNSGFSGRDIGPNTTKRIKEDGLFDELSGKKSNAKEDVENVTIHLVDCNFYKVKKNESAEKLWVKYSFEGGKYVKKIEKRQNAANNP